MPEFLQLEIEPTLRFTEKDLPEIADIKEGKQIKIIVNYHVIEKTKSFAIMRVGGMYTQKSRRKF